MTRVEVWATVGECENTGLSIAFQNLKLWKIVEGAGQRPLIHAFSEAKAQVAYVLRSLHKWDFDNVFGSFAILCIQLLSVSRTVTPRR